MKKAILFNDTTDEWHHGCDLVIQSIKKLLKKNKIELVYSSNSSADYTKDNKLKKIIEKFKIDLFVVNGEGSIHHDSERAIKLLNISNFAKKFKIKSVLINCTYAFNKNINNISLLKKFDLISVRENKSKHELQKFGIKALLVPDLSYYSIETLTNNHNNIQQVVVSDSVISKLTYKLHKYARKNNFKFLPILSFYKINIFQIKSYFGYLKFLVKNLINILFRFNNLDTNHSRFYGTRSVSSFLGTINNSKFFITGRYHSVCIAIKLKKPFVAIKSNTYKIEEMLKDIGLNENRIIEDMTDVNNMLKKKEILEFSSDELSNIDNYNINSISQIENLFILINKIL